LDIRALFLISCNVSVVIVNYKLAKMVSGLVESLLESPYAEYINIYVVDNNSPDDSVPYLQSRLGEISRFRKRGFFYAVDEDLMHTDIVNFGNVILLKSNDNRGFAAGNNKILRFILDSEISGDYVWLLNPDAIPSEKSIGNLIRFCNKNEMSMVGSIICSDDGTIQFFGGGRIKRVIGVPERYGKGCNIKALERIPEKELEFISGASIFLSVKTLRRIGLMPEEYFLYWEETDWCFRAARKNVSLKVCPNSIVYHAESSSVGLRTAFQYRIDMRNTLIFSRKYYPVYILSIILFKPIINGLSFIKNERRFSYIPIVGSYLGIIDFLKK